jgi:hypothetical protein
LIFRSAFQLALVEAEALETANAVNSVASIMFMANSSTVDWNEAHNIRPLDLPSINENVDIFMLSAAKAFIDGYNANGTSTAVEYDLDTVSAMGQKQGLALTTSKPFFIVTVVLAAMTMPLLLALCKSALARDRYPFDLNHVLAVWGDDGRKKMSSLATRSTEYEDI